jgi:hypothetical protein
MNILGILIFLAGPLLAVGWLITEFKADRKWRITLGLLSLITLTTVASLTTLIINQLNYNAWYGFATKELINETVSGIESGRTSIVLAELKKFQDEYYPTYENRARYVPLVNDTVERLKKASGKDSQGGAGASP